MDFKATRASGFKLSLISIDCIYDHISQIITIRTNIVINLLQFIRLGYITRQTINLLSDQYFQ